MTYRVTPLTPLTARAKPKICRAVGQFAFRSRQSGNITRKAEALKTKTLADKLDAAATKLRDEETETSPKDWFGYLGAAIVALGLLLVRGKGQ